MIALALAVLTLTAVNPVPRRAVDLARLSPGELIAYFDGWLEGWLEGAATADAEHYAPLDAAAADTVRRLANVPPRDVLEERRGNPAGAAAIRAGWTRAGLRKGAA